MAKYKHVGIRPTGELVRDPELFKHTYKRQRSLLEPSTGKYWTNRDLNSGCDSILSYPRTMEREGVTLLYCEHCNEWFNINQFKEIEE